MTHSTTAPMAGQRLQMLMEQYRVELERLNYGRATINVYLRSIGRLRSLMEHQDVALDQLTPNTIAPVSVWCAGEVKGAAAYRPGSIQRLFRVSGARDLARADIDGPPRIATTL
jgi:hypothetical protein